ncbi:MAG TPA: hypothetical protein VHD76_07280, partial [Bryobacteraceae bacterium]|nr:hypothetical protein [Bryobacteraceae bacterium]
GFAGIEPGVRQGRPDVGSSLSQRYYCRTFNDGQWAGSLPTWTLEVERWTLNVGSRSAGRP